MNPDDIPSAVAEANTITHTEFIAPSQTIKNNNSQEARKDEIQKLNYSNTDQISQQTKEPSPEKTLPVHETKVYLATPLEQKQAPESNLKVNTSMSNESVYQDIIRFSMGEQNPESEHDVFHTPNKYEMPPVGGSPIQEEEQIESAKNSKKRKDREFEETSLESLLQERESTKKVLLRRNSYDISEAKPIKIELEHTSKTKKISTIKKSKTMLMSPEKMEEVMSYF